MCERERISVCVHIVFAEFNSRDHWGSGLCVYMAEVPMTNVVGISSKNLGMCPGEQKTSPLRQTVLLFFSAKHVLPISPKHCVFCFVVFLQCC